MLAQIPVISSNIASIPELIEDGKEGILTKPKDCRKLANAIRTLFEDKSLRIKMGKNGRRKIEKNFNIHREVEKLIEMWES